MEYRELTPNEIDNLPEEFYEDVDKLKLNGRYHGGLSGSIVGAFDSGKLVGVWGVLLQIHCGPLWVSRDLRGNSSGIRSGMWNVVKSVVRRYGGKYAYMFAMDDTPQVLRIIKKLDSHTKIDGKAFLVGV